MATTKSGRLGGRCSPAAWRTALAAMAGAAMLLPMGAAAQEWRSSSALAGVEWPLSAYDWADALDGPRQVYLEQSAGDLGFYCGAAREFHAWNLEHRDDDAEAVRLDILGSYAAAGWTLTQPLAADPTIYLASRAAEQLAVRLYAIPERQALALFTCALQAEPATAAAITEAALAYRIASNKKDELPILGGLGLAALALALGALLLELRQRRRVNAAAGWEEVPALISESTIKTISRTSNNDYEFTSHTPIIHYSYRYAGVDYAGKRLRFGSSDTQEREDAEAVLAQYPVGATVVARVNPAKPGEATLQVEQPPLFRTMLPAIIFGVIGVVLLLATRFF